MMAQSMGMMGNQTNRDMKQMQEFTNELIQQISDRDQALQEQRHEKELWAHQMQTMQKETEEVTAERDALREQLRLP